MLFGSQLKDTGHQVLQKKNQEVWRKISYVWLSHTKNSGGMNQDVVLVILPLCSQTLGKLDICQRSAGRGQIQGRNLRNLRAGEEKQPEDLKWLLILVLFHLMLIYFFPKPNCYHHFLCQVKLNRRSCLEHMLKRDHITQGLERIL